jgi:hypothetical protein
MQSLRYWSFWRVLLASGGWFVFCVLITAAWAAFQFRRELTSLTSSGSGGIGAVSAGINEPFLWLVVLPPIILMVAWFMARWMGRSPAE